MNPDEAGSRRRHPTSRGRVPASLRAVHNVSHGGGQESSRRTENGRPSTFAVAAVVELAAGVVLATWAGSWRVAVTAAALFLVLAVIGARVDRRPR